MFKMEEKCCLQRFVLCCRSRTQSAILIPYHCTSSWYKSLVGCLHITNALPDFFPTESHSLCFLSFTPKPGILGSPHSLSGSPPGLKELQSCLELSHLEYSWFLRTNNGSRVWISYPRMLSAAVVSASFTLLPLCCPVSNFQILFQLQSQQTTVSSQLHIWCHSAVILHISLVSHFPPLPKPLSGH